MKQHITPNQAKEITKEQFYSLIPELVDREDWANYHHKKLTIGKMIEVIQEKYWIIIEQSSDSRSWNVVLYDKGKNTLYHQLHVVEKELVDALWDAVKSIL